MERTIKQVVVNDEIESVTDNVEDDIDFIGEREAITLYLNEVGKYPILKVEEEKQILEEVARGNMEAKEKLINSNLRLVISIAKNYQSNKIDIMDLIQDGNIGLIKAIEKFDKTKGCKFSTYATWWIRREMTVAIQENYSEIRLPANQHINVKKFKRIQNEFYQENMREATDAEIAQKMDFPLDKIKTIKSYLYSSVSLDMPVGDEAQLKDFIEDNRITDETVIKSVCGEEIEELIANSGLTEKEEAIIRMRFDLKNNKLNTLEEVAKNFGLTRESIRLNINKSLEKIRTTSAKQEYMFL